MILRLYKYPLILIEQYDNVVILYNNMIMLLH